MVQTDNVKPIVVNNTSQFQEVFKIPITKVPFTSRGRPRRYHKEIQTDNQDLSNEILALYFKGFSVEKKEKYQDKLTKL